MTGINVDFGANISGLTSGIAQASSQLSSFVSGANSRLESFGNTVGNIGQKMAIAFSAPLGLLGVQALKTSASFEQTQIAFETMLGSASKASYLIQELQKQASKSPLEEKDLQQGAKTLLNFGVAGNSVLPVLNQLSDISQGNAERFSGLSLAFGQMSSTGRLMGQDLNQMINAGFNPLQEISRTSGESMASLKKKMEDGSISVEMVSAAFKTATSEGGRFYGSTEKQSKSLAGLYSSMQDSIGKSLKGLGDDISEALNLKEIIPQVGAFISNIASAFSNLDPIFKKITVIFGGLLIVIPPILVGIGALIPIFTALSAGIALVSSPVLAVGAGIAGLAYIVTTNWTEIKKFLSDTGIWDGLALIVQNTFGVIKGVFTFTVAVIKSIWKDVLDTIHKDTFGIFGVITGVISSALQVIGGIIGVFSNLLQGNWSGLWDSLKNIMKGAFNAIVSITEGFTVFLVGAFQKVFEAFGADKIVAQFKQATDSIKKQFEGFKYKVELDKTENKTVNKKETTLDSDLGDGTKQKQEASEKEKKAQGKAQKDTEDLLIKLAQFRADVIDSEVQKAIEGETAKYEKEKNSIERTKANVKVKHDTLLALESSHNKAVSDIKAEAQKKESEFIINSITNQVVKERALEQLSFEDKLKNIPKIIQGKANQNKAIELLEIEHQAKMREIQSKGSIQSLDSNLTKKGSIGTKNTDGSDAFGQFQGFKTGLNLTNPMDSLINRMNASMPKMQAVIGKNVGLLMDLKDGINSSLQSGAANAAKGFASVLGQIASGSAKFSDLGGVLIGAASAMFSDFGNLLIEKGTAMLLLDVLKTNPITGGAAMIAAGILLSATASAGASTFSGGSSSSGASTSSYAQNYSSGAGSFGGGNSFAGSNGQKLNIQVDIGGEFTMRRNELVAGIRHTQKMETRTYGG
jgi:tape measure domain-containing protein